MPKKETTLDDVLSTVKDGFDDVDKRFTQVDNSLDKMNQRLDRIEKIVESWPPPSYIHDLLSRVSVIERHLNIKPKVRKKA